MISRGCEGAQHLARAAVRVGAEAVGVGHLRAVDPDAVQADGARRQACGAGGEVVGEFLMRLGYLPGAHAEDCPVHRRITRLRPPWMRSR